MCSGILSQKIKEYNNCAKDLVPYLLSANNTTQINTNQPLEKTLEDIYCKVEPCIIHIRPGANSSDLRKEITDALQAKAHNFHNLDINGFIRDENERKTSIGQEIHSMVSGNKIIPNEMIVRMLKKIIYSGDMTKTNFILSSFPDIIEQAKEFEINCSKISTIIYCSGEGPFVEIKNNNLSLFNIDSFFQKEFRLKTMEKWDSEVFNEKLGKSVDFGFAIGNQFTGKTTLSNVMHDNFEYIVINMQTFSDKIKASRGTEEEPYEGKISIGDVEVAVSKFI